MRAGTVIGLGILAFAVAYWGGVAVAANDIQVLFKTVSFQGLTNLQIILTFQNPTPGTLKIDSFAGTVSVNGDQFGNISMFQTIEIQPNSQQDIPFTLQISILQLPAAIKDMINTGHGVYDFRVDGTLNLNGTTFPIDVDQSVDVNAF